MHIYYIDLSTKYSGRPYKKITGQINSDIAKASQVALFFYENIKLPHLNPRVIQETDCLFLLLHTVMCVE